MPNSCEACGEDVEGSFCFKCGRYLCEKCAQYDKYGNAYCNDCHKELEWWMKQST